MLIKSVLYELVLQVKAGGVAADLVHPVLSGLGVAASDIVEEERPKVRKVSVFFAQQKSARQLQAAFRASGVKGVKVSLRAHHRTDWETRWKEGWKPFPLTRKIQVIPLFLTDATCPRGKLPLYLDTTAAFGTGLHETTRFSAQLIEGLDGRFLSFLDVGTGTGILAMVAMMSGAKHAEAFDIDAAAVKVAAKNLKANGLRCAVLKACAVKGYSSRRKFDLVAANLITHDLVAFRPKIVSLVEPGGHLIISGISLKNMPVVRKTYNMASGLKCLRVVKGREWSAFLFRKI